MTQYTNAYEKLYDNMKKRFTVADESGEYTLGEYMLKKAGQKSTASVSASQKSNLPVAKGHNEQRAITAIFSYVNDKLLIKKPPQKDKTIKAFPFRTSIAAFLSAAVTCSLIFSFSFLAVKGFSAANGDNIVEADVQDTPETAEEIYETVS